MVLLRQGMHHARNYYNSETQMIRNNFSRSLVARAQRNGLSKAEVKLLAAKRHSEAEKKRRTKINKQYSGLREILPNLIKKDKATLLAETIKQVKELKKKVSEIKENGPREVKFPSETDKLHLEKCNDEKGLVKATLSYDDIPGLMSAIARALGSAKAKVIKAEMVTIGGRTRSVLWLQSTENESLGLLKSTLKAVMHNPSLKMRRFTQ